MDPLIIAGKSYESRLLVGTGKYRDFDETRRAIEASGAQIVTVAGAISGASTTAIGASVINADIVTTTDAWVDGRATVAAAPR